MLLASCTLQCALQHGFRCPGRTHVCAGHRSATVRTVSARMLVVYTKQCTLHARPTLSCMHTCACRVGSGQTSGQMHWHCMCCTCSTCQCTAHDVMCVQCMHTACTASCASTAPACCWLVHALCMHCSMLTHVVPTFVCTLRRLRGTRQAVPCLALGGPTSPGCLSGTLRAPATGVRRLDPA